MGLTSSRKSTSDGLRSSQNLRGKSKVGLVYDVILDESHPKIKETGIEGALMGAIIFRTTDDLSVPDESSLPIAFPIDKGLKSLPIRNEEVEIYEFTEGFYGYRRLGLEINPTTNVAEDAIEKTFRPEESSNSKQGNYNKVQKTNISRSNSNQSNTVGFGEYFEPQLGIHKLKLYEGDSLIESRFGQSIRFSAYNNEGKVFSPTTIIRNSESPENRKVDENLPVEENINEDGSTILLSSNEYQVNFSPTTTEKTPKSFNPGERNDKSYPQKFIGDQILINSGRLIFSAKNEEMLFFSKKNYAFVSDGGLSIDNQQGIDINIKNDFTVVTNDADFYINAGQGSIILGGGIDNEREPIVKGNTLVEILSELIKILGQAQFSTAVGPTAPGPIDKASLKNLSNKLNDCLSNYNSTI